MEEGACRCLAGEHTEMPEPRGKILMHLCEQGHYTLKSRIDDWQKNTREMKQAATCHENVCTFVCTPSCVKTRSMDP